MRKLRKPLSVLLSLVMVLGVFAIVPFTVSAQAAVTYTEYSWNGSALQTTEKTVTDYTVVTKDIIKNSPDNGSGLKTGTYLVNSDTTVDDYFYIRKNQTVNLIVKPGVTLTCKKGIGCGYDNNNQAATLNIYGTGKIVATGKNQAAGIGGNNDETNGWITVHGTTIEATGGKHGAGIGGGEGGKDPDATSPTITIYDGNITATGGIDGAGIGGGDEQPGARTYIYGGTIDASSKKHGAGIGGGDEEGTFGVWIYGGTVTAAGGYRGAGIGAGEEGGNLRKSPDGGVNILGGTVTATGGSGGAGVGGGYDEDMSGTINITGEATKLTATGGIGGAGIGAGKGKDGDWCVPDGDMSGTITIDCGEQSDINIFGGDEETDGGRRSTGGAGIGAGFAGNQYGKVYIRGGNIVITGGAKAAGIGGGKESDSGKYGGEGGDVYIGGGNITIYTINTEWYNEEKNHAIGSGFEDIKDGSVYIHANNNTTGKYMRVDYKPLNKNDFMTASTSQRSKKAHTRCTLHIQECNHKDYYGKDGLTKKITPSQHIITCKYCGYTDQGAHESETYCFCGYNSENCCTVTLRDTVGSEQFKVLKGGEIILPDYNGAVSQTTDIPEQYYRVSGWTLNGDASGKVYEQGEEVIANSDMTFTTQREALYKLNFENVQHGSIHADITNNEAYASVGETLKFDIEADPGYSVSKVTYKMMTGFDLDDSYNIVYQYSDPVEMQPVDGKYQLTMPEFSASYNNRIVISAEVSENTVNPIYISENIENGTVTSDKETAAPNDSVTLTVTPDEGCFLDELRCKATDGTELELTQTDDTHYTFSMPAYPVSVTAEFSDNFGTHLAGHSISLDGDVAVNFYMQLDPEITSHEGLKMQFTVPDTSTEYQYQEIEVSDDIKDGEYYVFKCRVAAKNMDSIISAQLVDDDNNKSIIYTYSVKEYADYLLENANENGTTEQKSYAKAAPLVTAMLVYGDNAAYYFDKTGEEPDTVEATIPEYGSTVHNTMPVGVTFTGATVSLKSQTSLSLYFESDQKIELTCDGYTKETKHSGKEYVIRIRNIAVYNLNKPITVKVNGEDAVTYSPLTYCYKAQTTDNAKLVNTVKALYNYYLAAKEYFD